MADREKLVIAIERAKEQSEEYGLDRILVDFKAADMILELLKEQEPVKPIERNGFYYCGACRYALMTNHQKYCSDCGRRMKWE